MTAPASRRAPTSSPGTPTRTPYRVAASTDPKRSSTSPAPGTPGLAWLSFSTSTGRVPPAATAKCATEPARRTRRRAVVGGAHPQVGAGGLLGGARPLGHRERGTEPVRRRGVGVEGDPAGGPDAAGGAGDDVDPTGAVERARGADDELVAAVGVEVAQRDGRAEGVPGVGLQPEVGGEQQAARRRRQPEVDRAGAVPPGEPDHQVGQAVAVQVAGDGHLGLAPGRRGVGARERDQHRGEGHRHDQDQVPLRHAGAPRRRGGCGRARGLGHGPAGASTSTLRPGGPVAPFRR